MKPYLLYFVLTEPGTKNITIRSPEKKSAKVSKSRYLKLWSKMEAFKVRFDNEAYFWRSWAFLNNQVHVFHPFIWWWYCYLKKIKFLTGINPVISRFFFPLSFKTVSTYSYVFILGNIRKFLWYKTVVNIDLQFSVWKIKLWNKYFKRTLTLQNYEKVTKH